MFAQCCVGIWQSRRSRVLLLGMVSGLGRYQHPWGQTGHLIWHEFLSCHRDQILYRKQLKEARLIFKPRRIYSIVEGVAMGKQEAVGHIAAGMRWSPWEG